MTTKDESLQQTGRCAAASIVEMVAALECDYDRLEELKDYQTGYADAEDWGTECPHEATELAGLILAAGECSSQDEARERIQEDALSVEVRGDWCSIGSMDELAQPTEFKILLSTGGPASRIRGELDEHCEPRRAWLEVQDWGTPWTQHFDIEQETLLTYARCFYFGDG